MAKDLRKDGLGVEVRRNKGSVGNRRWGGQAEAALARWEASESPGGLAEASVPSPHNARQDTAHLMFQVRQAKGMSVVALPTARQGSEQVVDSPGEGLAKKDILGLQGWHMAESCEVGHDVVHLAPQETTGVVDGPQGGAKKLEALRSAGHSPRQAQVPESTLGGRGGEDEALVLPELALET